MRQKVVGTDIIHFIPQHKAPAGTKVTYINFIFDIHPLKEEECRVRLTVAGGKLDHYGDSAYPAISLLSTKYFLIVSYLKPTRTPDMALQI